ncbi:MAG: hypothetical protein WKF84_07445 [Pyrinomonadaceae bacterium]
MLGNSYIQTRTHVDGGKRDAFARMFKVAPASAAAHLINAQMMIRQQFEEFAEGELSRALEIDPDAAASQFHDGRVGDTSRRRLTAA